MKNDSFARAIEHKKYGDKTNSDKRWDRKIRKIDYGNQIIQNPLKKRVKRM